MTEPQPPLSSTTRLALTFAFVTMLVDTIGLGIVIPVTPQIIAQLTGHDPHAADAMSNAASWGGWLMFVFAFMQFFCAPLMGNLSDRFGRRPVLIVSLLALGVDYLITGLAPTIAWLFIGRTLSGMAGASYPTVNAYIADVTPPEKRAANFGLVGAAFGLGFVIGPAMGGLIGEFFGPRAPFFVAAAIAVANALFGLLVLKESLPPERRRKFEILRANPLGALTALRRYPHVMVMLGVVVLMRLAHDANPSIFNYFVILQFHWTPFDVGAALAALGLMISLVFGVLTRVVTPRIGETASVWLGLICEGVAFIGYALSTSGWMMYVWMTVWAFSGLAGPSINAILSRQVAPNEQGELQGALASAGGLTSIVAPVLLTALFAWFTGPRAPIYFPGAAFFAAGLFAFGALAVFAGMHKQPRPLPAAQT